jgi:hypothetical protein
MKMKKVAKATVAIKHKLKKALLFKFVVKNKGKATYFSSSININIYNRL